MIEVLDEAFGDLRQIDVDIRLHGDIDLCVRRYARPVAPGYRGSGGWN